MCFSPSISVYDCGEYFIDRLVADRADIPGKVFPAGFVPSIPVRSLMMMSIQRISSGIKVIILLGQRQPKTIYFMSPVVRELASFVIASFM